jgi:LytS/YehU family sensor histidine kinase
MTTPTRGMPWAERLLAQLPLWLAAMWWGSMSAVGFWVVPLLFAYLPSPALAGATAAKLFTAQTWIALISGVLLLVISNRKRFETQEKPAQVATVFIVSGMLLALLSEFAVAPRIVLRENLALWHAAGSVMYLAHWVCAGLVLHKVSRADPS